MPSNGFEMRVYVPKDGQPRPHFDRFEEGVEKAYVFLTDPRLSDFALAVGPVQRDAPVPALMLERKPDVGVLVQLYLPERMSPEGQDGWYNLVEPADLDRVSIDDVSTVWEKPDRDDMVETRLSQGVLFSRRMYVPPELAEEALTFYLDGRSLDDTLKKKPWKFIGLI